MAQILIDTNVLVDVIRGFTPTIHQLEEIETESELCVSVITEMELIVGCKKKQDLKSVESFLDNFEIISIDSNTANQAIKLLRTYRLSHGLLMPDALIAASVIENDLLLFTRNQKDFQFIKGITLVPID